MYLMGALCYRDCNKVHLDNCGIGACASDGETCGISIGMMFVDLAFAIAESVAFVMTLGASSVGTPGLRAARETIQNVFDNTSKSVIRKSAKHVRNVVNRQGKASKFREMRDYAYEECKDFATSTVVETVCEEVGNKILDDMNEE